MKASAKLAVGLGLLLVAAAVATLAVRATWFVVQAPGTVVELPGTGTARLPGRAVSVSGADLVPVASALGVLLLILAALAFLVGPRARTASLVAAALFGLAGTLSVLLVDGGDARTHARIPAADVRATAARGTAAVAFAFSVPIALATVPAARSMRRWGMPEGAPQG